MRQRAAQRARKAERGSRPEGYGERRRRAADGAYERLHVHAYGHTGEMWEEIVASWRSDPSSSLVLPGQMARERFLRREGARTLWGGRRVITLEELWREVAAAVGDLPQELTAPEVEPLLAEQVQDFDRLRSLVEHRGGLKALHRHLEEIEKQADADYAPQNELEEQIAELRRRLNGRPRVLMAARRSEIARRAKQADLGRALHFAPLPEPSRQLGGLLKGLCRRNETHAYVLAGAGLLDEWLERVGLPADRVVRRPSAGAAASALFAGGEPSRPRRPQLEWLRAEDEASVAVELAGRWIASGIAPERIAILAPRVEELAHPISRAGREAGVPVLVRDAVEPQETRVSRTLLQLARRGPDGLPESELAELEELGGGPEDLERLAAARAKGKAAELRALYLLGRRLAQSCDAYEASRAHAWLDGLHGAVRAVLREGVEPWSVAELLAATVSLRAPRGDEAGVLLASYAEAPALRLDGAIMIGLNDGELPGRHQRSPFTSEELLTACPALRPASERGLFASACAAAGERLALICTASRERSPSPFFTESQRVWDAPGETPEAGLRAARVRARRLARGRDGSHPAIRDALARIARERLPEPWRDHGGRRAYAVTELESYLRCPYGWFVRHVLMPQAPPSESQLLGSLVHEILAEALEEPQAGRPALVARRLAEAQIAANARRVVEPRLERVLAEFAGDGWPFPERRAELSLRLVEESDDFGEVVLYGRADRVDLRPAGERKQLLVLDYKSKPSQRLEDWQLQPFLYPHMAEAQLGAQALGFLYVSVREGTAHGWLAHRVPELARYQVSDNGWRDYLKRARRRTREAIDGIEEGLWSRIGRNCPRHCPHNLLSDTGVTT